MREVPAAFNQRLKATFGADYDMRWDPVVSRYALHSVSAGGRPIVQFWCWFYDPKTGQPLEPDPVTQIHPFRELDLVAQEEIIRNLHRSYIGKTGHGAKDWAADHAARRQHNADVMTARRKKRANDYADIIGELALGRPWLKHHTGSEQSRRVAQGVR